jgi:hypothetical protein
MMATFTPTADLQDVPDGALLPPGCDIKIDVITGRKQARFMPNSAEKAALHQSGLSGEDFGRKAKPNGQAGPVIATAFNPADTKWQWHPYVPAGAITILGAKGGGGKGLVGTAMTASATAKACGLIVPQ